MRRTFLYLANIILENYKNEYRASCNCWELAVDRRKNGEKKMEEVFTSLGNDHARKADALLKIILSENIATPDAIAAINIEIRAEARN